MSDKDRKTVEPVPEEENDTIPDHVFVDEESPGAGTGDINPIGRNSDRPGIGSTGGYAPDGPEELGRSRTRTIVEQLDRPPRFEEVIDETDRQYLDLDNPSGC